MGDVGSFFLTGTTGGVFFLYILPGGLVRGFGGFLSIGREGKYEGDGGGGIVVDVHY